MVRITLPEGLEHDLYGYASRNHAVPIMAAAQAFSSSVYRDSGLSLREFEGARMRTAQINGCQICRTFRAARDAPTMFSVGGETPGRMVTDNGPPPDEAFYDHVASWRSASDFSDRERLAIEFAERFAEQPKVLSADERFWARMHAVFNDGEIVDLAHCVAAWVGLGRVAHVLGFDTVCLVAPATERAA
ncbi:carboxymuconolactone decarboxylase family protein [Novosphingobium sp. FKTRR1]|uniref:carboxymuconolactone decarboxylase family protein n=1 Tax=Novosphingobium sp. FKTRR1 TaxID=2879118 RepID=UPI001CF0C880|nr:carboxymuconolactone decarboxylase family protein [Novosphingobium sp. FKTRR1]